MKSVENKLKNETNWQIRNTPLIMDTKFASICGMCYDEEALKLNSYIVMDIGNGHTTVASIENGKIQGVCAASEGSRAASGGCGRRADHAREKFS